mmetsp:Transcript_54005/g.110238  ORF Transcript_54005/g.110238 Transcript_54005/m.110238 type:complete len:204 (+) Transcript_54005:206-817(+)
MRSMRRTGSAAPHSSWSPTVKQVTYSGPRFILRSRPTGTVSLPLTAAGERCVRVSSLVLGTRRTHSLCEAMVASMSDSAMSPFSFSVIAWLWQRMAPTRTHCPSIGIWVVVPRILFVSATPFHSSFVWPFSIALSIQGMREPARGAPKLEAGKASLLMAAVTAVSSLRMSPLSSLRLSSTAPIFSICLMSSRMFLAPAPEADW